MVLPSNVRLKDKPVWQCQSTRKTVHGHTGMDKMHKSKEKFGV
jgi:hypothetical protein